MTDSSTGKGPPTSPQFPWDEAHSAALNAQRLLQRVAEEIAREVGLPHGRAKDWPFTAPSPSADVRETESAVIVTLDVPGVDQQDLATTWESGRLIIEGNRTMPESEGETRRSERNFGPFRKEVRIEAEVLVDQIRAEMKNGVLTVTLPKKPKAQGIKIDVKVS